MRILTAGVSQGKGVEKIDENNPSMKKSDLIILKHEG